MKIRNSNFVGRLERRSRNVSVVLAAVFAVPNITANRVRSRAKDGMKAMTHQPPCLSFLLLSLAIPFFLGGSPAMAAYVREWVAPHGGHTGLATGGSVGGLAVASADAFWDMEGDGIPEIVVRGDAFHFEAYDGATHNLEWSYISPPDAPMDFWGFWDIDGDGLKEAVGQVTGGPYAKRVVFLNWQTGVIEFTLEDPRRQYDIVILAIRDFDSDGKPEILVGLSELSHRLQLELWGDGTTTADAGQIPPPLESVVFLTASVPNPSDGTSRISFEIRETGDIDLGVFDTQGRRVRTLRRGPTEHGAYDAEWDGADDAGRRVAAGVYYFKLTSHGSIAETKAVVLR